MCQRQEGVDTLWPRQVNHFEPRLPIEGMSLEFDTLFFLSQKFLEGVEEKRGQSNCTFRNTTNCYFCLSFAELFLLIVCGAKNISLIFSKYLIKNENIPLAFKKKLHAAERRKARLKNAHGILCGAIEPE